MSWYTSRVGRGGFRSTIDRETGCVYVRTRHGSVEYTSMIAPGVNADFDKRGRLVGVEIIR